MEPDVTVLIVFQLHGWYRAGTKFVPLLLAKGEKMPKEIQRQARKEALVTSSEESEDCTNTDSGSGKPEGSASKMDGWMECGAKEFH